MVHATITKVVMLARVLAPLVLAPLLAPVVLAPVAVALLGVLLLYDTELLKKMPRTLSCELHERVRRDFIVLLLLLGSGPC